MTLLRIVRDELQTLTERTVALAAEAPFRRVCEDGEIVGNLVPTDSQLRAATEHYERFCRWRAAVATVLRRHGVVTAARFQTAADELSRLVLLRRGDTPDITAREWRAGFASHVEELARELSKVVDEAANAFTVVVRRPTPYEVLDVRIDPQPSVGAICCNVPGGNRSDVRTLRPMIEIGQALFRRFVDYRVYRAALDEAKRRGQVLRVRLDLTHGGPLSSMPWELLHDGADFVALRTSTILTRLIIANVVVPSVPVAPPLRILMTLSMPRSLQWFDVERERRLVEDAIAPLRLQGLVELDVCADGRATTVRRLVRNAAAAGRPYHIWHFVGHGQYDERSARGEVAFTTEDRQPHWVGGIELTHIFAEARDLRLVILNSCDGVRGRDDPGSAVASVCVAAGIPAVVAMQVEISQPSAIAFADELYGSIAAGLPVSAAVTEARHAIFLQPNYMEWMTPVAFIAGEDAPIMALGE